MLAACFLPRGRPGLITAVCGAVMATLVVFCAPPALACVKAFESEQLAAAAGSCSSYNERRLQP